MLEAQEPGQAATVATALAPGVTTGVTTAEQLDTAWDKLTLDVGGLNTPKNDARVKGVFDAYNAWLVVRWDGTDYVTPHPVSGNTLTQALSSFAVQRAAADQLATLFPKKVIVPSTAPTKIIEAPTEYVTGTVPWWYWPLRIGGGIGAGLIIYKLLRPEHQSQRQLSGLGNKEFSKAVFNPHGLSYDQWLKAARKSDEYYGYEPRYRDKLRNAWKSGESPSEWL